VNTTTRFQASDVMTPANVLTIARIVLAPPLFALILLAEDRRGASWAAFVLGVVIALTDNFDGKLARRWGTTRSGAFLDPLADKIVVLGVMFSLVAVDRYHWLPVAIVTVREVAISVWRSRWARRGVAIPARRSAKHKTLVQGIALLVAVLPPLEDHSWPIDGLLWIAVAFTVVTGLQYALDGQRAMSLTGDRPGRIREV
jgi:CDP-diacylglycerol--glycerol-3-phosphate 3-phosphatidyltransferase